MLKGNIPRFSWEPSSTMLANRLCGTIDKSVSNRTGRFELLPIQLRCASPKNHGPLEHNLLSARRAHDGL